MGSPKPGVEGKGCHSVSVGEVIGRCQLRENRWSRNVAPFCSGQKFWGKFSGLVLWDG